MTKKQSLLLLIRILSDLGMVCLAWALAYYLRFYTMWESPKGLPPATLYVKLIPFICVIWLSTLAAAGFYRRTGRHRSPFVEGLDIVQVCTFATLAFISFTYFYNEYRYSRGVLFVFYTLHIFFIISARSGIRKALRWYRRHSPSRKVLIFAFDQSLLKTLDLQTEAYTSRQEIVGAISIGGDTDKFSEICRHLNIKKLDAPENVGKFLQDNDIQTVIMAVPQNRYDFLEENFADIANQVSDVRIIPDLARYGKLASGIEVVNGTPVINLHDSPLDGVGSVIKRIMDVFGAGIGILLVSPLLILIAILVRLSSRGPIFYRQERVGLDGRKFTMLKFRSMPIDAEAQTGAIWAKKGDNRATFIGKFLRKSSLDELPQLFNILKGEMSLVGPRPERPVFVSQFRQNIPGYMLRHKVKAGLTGWAQINGWRGNTSLEKRIECDLYYIQNWSVWLDIRIIMLTVVRGFFSKNAY